MEPLSEAEQAAWRARCPPTRRPRCAATFPIGWSRRSTRAFGEAAAEEGAALARRAPVDLRVNTLKADRDKVLKALARFAPEPTPLSPIGVRLPAPEGPGRQPNVEAETGHGKGWYEVQDEGSQIAALMAAPGPASRCSIFVQAPAARRWPSPPPCATPARSTPTTTMRRACGRSSSG